MNFDVPICRRIRTSYGEKKFALDANSMAKHGIHPMTNSIYKYKDCKLFAGVINIYSFLYPLQKLFATNANNICQICLLQTSNKFDN